jgi:predicted Zn-dependent peptidase
MPLIVEHIPGVRSAALCWLIPIGCAHDPADKLGMASMLAELVLRGAGSRDSRQAADALDALGLARSVDVGPVYLRITATMIADQLPAALPLLADIVLRPRFDAEHIEPTRELQLQALAGLKDNPQERAGIILSRLHNPAPFNRSSLGTEDGLKAISRDDVLAHWQRNVRPVGSILSIAGDVHAETIAAQLNTLLASWSGTAPAISAAPNSAAGSHHHEHDESNQTHIFLAHNAPSEPDPRSILEKITAAVLSGGSSSRLFTEVREKRGLCYAVSAMYGADKLFGRLIAYVGTTPERAQQSLDVLMSELRRINSPDPANAITQEEFDHAIIGYRSRLVFSGESTGARAIQLAMDQHRLGKPRSLDDLKHQVEAISLADVNAYLRSRTLGTTTLVTLGPKPLTFPA